MRFFIIVLLSVSIISCKNDTDKNSNNFISKYGEFKQSKDDLLNGVSWAVSYSGFREGQHPDRGDGANNPSYEETLEDLKILSKNSNFSLIRVYDSGANSQTVLKVIEENKLNIKVLLGIWINAEISNHEKCPWVNSPIPVEVLEQNKIKNIAEIRQGIELAKKYSEIIVAVNVGNEALVEWTGHLVSSKKIIEYVEMVKSEINQPVTVADNYEWWRDHGTELAKVVDFISIHVYPLWEGKDIDTAFAYSVANVNEVHAALPESKIVITELGWTTVASEFGERASEEKQIRYYNEMKAWANEANITTFFFEAFDEPWKGDPNNMQGAEKHWGLFSVDRKPKLVMKELYPEL